MQHAFRIFSFIAITLLAVSGAFSASAQSQDVQSSLRIAAVVNDDAISVMDLERRILMIIATSDMARTQETFSRLAPQVLRGLIDEKIQTQEAERLGIEVSPEELDRAFAQLERQNNIAPGGLEAFLNNLGVEKSDVQQRTHAEIAWSKVVRNTLAPRVQIGQDEITANIAQIKKNTGKPTYLISEIFLSIPSVKQEPQIKELADRLVQQLQSGANFAALAQNFSQSPAAATGGDLGWVREGQLDPQLEALALKLAPGQISFPIRTLSGYHIIALRDKRKDPGLGVDEDTMLTLQQVVLPVDRNATEAETKLRLEQARALTKDIRNCESFESAGKKTGSPLSGNLGSVKLGNLPAELSAIVGDLPIGMPSEPITSESGIMVLMVCERMGNMSGIDTVREKIRKDLFNERLSIAARRHLRDLRRTAFVDIRL